MSWRSILLQVPVSQAVRGSEFGNDQLRQVVSENIFLGLLIDILSLVHHASQYASEIQHAVRA